MSASLDHENMPIDLRSIGARVWQKRYRIIVVTTLLCAIAYMLVAMIPKTYESSASILVESRENTFTRATNDTGTGGVGSSDAVVMSSQVELVQSSENFLRVIRDLNLAEISEFNGTASSPLDPLRALLGSAPNRVKGNEQKVLALLTKAVTVIQERDSRIITVLVRAQDRDLAAKIANSIAETHVSRRAELSNNDTAGASVWLQAEIEKLRVSVGEAESAVATFRVENDLFTGTNNTSLLDQQLSNISTQISTAQERKITAHSRATLIRNLLNAGQPIDGVAEIQNSVIIQRLSQDKARLQGEQAQLSATLLPNHPQVRSITAQVNQINQQILREGRQVADAIMAQSRIEDTLVATLQDDLARLKISASSAATSSVELLELEREASAQSALLQTYLLRFREATARTGSGAVLPDVRVITIAMPALQPVAPKASMILIAVAIVAVSVQIGGILFAELTTMLPHHTAREEVAREEVARQAPADIPDHLAEQAPLQQMPEPASQPINAESDAQVNSEKSVPEEKPSLTTRAHSFVQQNITRFKDKPEQPRINVSQLNAERKSRTRKMPNQPVERAAFVQEPPQQEPPQHAAAAQSAAHSTEQDFYDLAEALCTGQERLVFITAYDRAGDCTGVGEMLISEIMASGRTVAIVDAGSRVVSSRPGISDLAADAAEFGQVVFSSDSGLTEVYWGTRSNIFHSSEKPATLVEALSDICDVVLVFAGSVGVASNLPLFAGLDGTLALIAGVEPDYDSAENALDEAEDLGFARSRLLLVAKQQVHAA